MKTNLKNFPKPIQGKPTMQKLVRLIEDDEQWKKAFEKELRDELAYALRAMKEWRGEGKKPHRVDEEIAHEWQGIIIAVKQVLGVQDVPNEQLIKELLGE